MAPHLPRDVLCDASATSIERAKCTKPEEFLERLRPRHWSQACQGSWLFRGHADGTWNLVPSALRKEAWGRLAPHFDPEKATPSQRAAMELGLLRWFGDHLRLAGISVDVEHHPPGTFASANDWLPRPLASLAQHYGLPTRLLDFSIGPLVAAYFAARESPGESRQDQHLAVWAVDSRWIVAHGSSELRVYHPPRTANANLKAQLGAFVYWGTGSITGNTADMEPLDSRVCRINRSGSGKSNGEPVNAKPPPMHLITLPSRHRIELLQLLAKEGIDGSAIFPGIHGIVARIGEQAEFLKEPFLARGAVPPWGDEDALFTQLSTSGYRMLDTDASE